MKGINNKVVVIGLDGATFDLMKPWIEESKLPNIAGLIEGGIHGQLESTFPPFTAPAWASFMTGKNPGNHGILDFTYKKRGTYDRSLVNAGSLRAETLWNIISLHGQTVGLVNIPLTYPPDPTTRGFIISGLETPGLSCTFTHPAALRAELLNGIGDYVIDLNLGRYGADRQIDFIRDLHYMTEMRRRAILYLMKRYDWNLFMAVFIGTDRIQHVFWNYLDEDHPLFDSKEARRYRKSTRYFYQRIDTIIGEILQNIEDEMTVIILSDHGFGPLHKKVYINNWLRDLGLLNLKGLRGSKEDARLIFPDNFFVNWVSNKRKNLCEIDWSRTKAYSGHDSQLGIYINLEGREPQGIVRPGEEYERLRDFVIGELNKLKDPESGEGIVDRAFRREEIYSGPFIEDAPDILFILKDFKYQPLDDLEGEGILQPPQKWSTGLHRMNGILIMKGKQIRKGVEIKGAKIVDLAPTILHLLGIPVPEDMEGKVLV